MSWVTSCFDDCKQRMDKQRRVVAKCQEELKTLPWYRIFRRMSLESNIYYAQQEFDKAKSDWYRLWS